MIKNLKQPLIHLSLFIVTFITTTLAGAEWSYGKSVFAASFTWQDFVNGMSYSIPFLLILTAHEFGHYFTAVYYKVNTTLPYYIPLPPLGFMFGTLGAIIRIKSHIRSKQQHFDIGIAGPLAGFIVSLMVLFYGFTHLPPPEYIFQFHPEYEQYGVDYANYVYQAENLLPGTADVVLGKNLLFIFFEKFIADPARVPNVHEIMHYPFLFAGFLSLIFTSINLLPIGQLDGGHVLYGLLGYKRHKQAATVVFLIFLFYAGLGYINPSQPNEDLMWHIPLFIGFMYLSLTGLKLPWKDTLMYAVILFAIQYLISTFFMVQGYSGWLLFAFIIGKFLGIAHPPSEIEEPLSVERKILGWIALAIFIISFTPNPIELLIVPMVAP